MAKWGNALGGWRKQRRTKGGQFGSGGASSKKASSVKKRKASSAAPKKSMSPKRRATVKKVAIAGAAVGVVGVAAYAGHQYAKETGLKKKHGSDYLPRKVPVYHYTYGNSARKITKSQSFISKQRYGLPGTPTGIWFTNQADDNRASMEIQYGENLLKTKVRRKHIERNVKPFRNEDHRWLMVDQKHVGARAGYRVSYARKQKLSQETIERARNVRQARARQGARANGFAQV